MGYKKLPSEGGSFIGLETWADSWANTTTQVYITRHGPRIVVQGRSTLTGTPTDASFDITIPTKYTAASFFSSVEGAIVGDAFLVDASGNDHGGSVFITTTTNLKVKVADVTGSLVVMNELNAGSPHVWTTTDVIEFDATWVVADWV